MDISSLDFLKKRLDEKNLRKLSDLKNQALFDFVSQFVNLCNPKSVFVRSDSLEDIQYIRKKTQDYGEEKGLATKGQSIHFDGYFDQGRDKDNTRYLFKEAESQGYYLNGIERQKGLDEIRNYLKDIMHDKEMFICFFCLGPLNCDFSILAVQITDSSYVAHSEDILYRLGYEEFKKKTNQGFFKFVHSAGRLENYVSKDVDKRRIYIDLEDDLVYSINTQYAGNSVGLKKLSLRLAIQKASRENWLAEHMFIVGVHNKEGEKAYFCGAYPSMCGKTSTAMITGESIIGDDIAYLREQDGSAFCVNAERGIFGIIEGVNPKDDPTLMKGLANGGEVIFSNVCMDEKGIPFWVGKPGSLVTRGINFSGEWFSGKTNSKGKEIPISHKNARYTIRLSELDNVDENLENPKGVLVKGIIYGGRDSDTSCPLEESLSWQHGVITKGASLESETTAATLGQEGVREFNPMSNMDFLSILLGKYIKMHLDFGARLKCPPHIFSVNYFLKNKQGKFLNDMEDKRVWLKWMRERVDGQVRVLVTPSGLIPKYNDLKYLFKKTLKKNYSRADYIEQFTLRIPQNLAKIERITNIYKELKEIPPILFNELKAQELRLKECQKIHGDYVAPFSFKEE